MSKTDSFLRLRALFYARHKEVLLYLLFGGLSFLVNVGLFMLLNGALGMDALVANSITWGVTVAFVYVTNKLWVFKVELHTRGELVRQIVSFFAGRLVTLAIEEAMLFVCITKLGLNSVVVKIVAQVVVIVLNYVISKCVVFSRRISMRRFSKKLCGNETARYYATYTALWSVCAVVLFVIFKANGKAFLWKADGLFQHFAAFNYTCTFWRAVFTEHTFPLFDWTIGQGGDMLTMLNSYDFTDPITLFTAMLLPLSRLSRYTLMIFIKLWLVGASFSFYCHATGHKDTAAVLCGSLAYTFSGVVLFSFVRHPNYINWAYFLPYLLAGSELYLRSKKKLPLVIFVFWSLLTSYYTFYMNMIIVVLYVVVQIVCVAIQEKSVAALGRGVVSAVRLAGVFCFGALVSSCVLLPTIYAYITNDRVVQATGYTASAWHYASAYYPALAYSVFAPFASPGYYTNLGLNAICIIPIAFLFSKRKDVRPVQVLLILFALMLCVPLAGRIMNGGGYATNRWSYAVAFAVSVALVQTFNQFRVMGKAEQTKAAVCTALVALVTSAELIGLANMNASVKVRGAGALGLVAVLFVLAMVRCAVGSKKVLSGKAIILLCLVGCIVQIGGTFSSGFGNYVGEHYAVSETKKKMEHWSARSAMNLDGGFYRIEKEERSPNGESTNMNAFLSSRGTSLWWSLIPSWVHSFYTNLALDSVHQNCMFNGLDGRTGLLALASVRYYTRPQESNGPVPYGFEARNSEDPDYEVFENGYFLPVGWVYSSYISDSEYKELDGIEKEYAMLKGAVIDEPLPWLNQTHADSVCKEIPFTVEELNSVTLAEHEIVVSKNNGSIVLSADIPENCEVHLYIDGLVLKGNPSSISLNVSRAHDSYFVKKPSTISRSTYNWYVNRSAITYNLGYGHAGQNTITLTFSNNSRLSYNSIAVVAVPMSYYREQMEKLQAHVLQNVVVANGTVSGSITVTEPGLLQFSVPYSKGWHATLDGSSVTVLRSNGMYMAIPVEAGNHDVRLVYHTPYAGLGMLLSVLVVAAWGIYALVSRRCRGKARALYLRVQDL